MSFLHPVRVGDTVACYAWVERIGRTSMTIPVEVWVQPYRRTEQTRVTHAIFTYVALDEERKTNPGDVAKATRSPLRRMTAGPLLARRCQTSPTRDQTDVVSTGSDGCRLFAASSIARPDNSRLLLVAGDTRSCARIS